MKFLTNQLVRSATLFNLVSNMATAYSLMVREARGDILNPGAQISKAGAEFMPPGTQY